MSRSGLRQLALIVGVGVLVAGCSRSVDIDVDVALAEGVTAQAEGREDVEIGRAHV
jgi:hypothetical protein